MVGKTMYNNDVSKTATHFLCGAQLVKEATSAYRLASENWAYPIKQFGSTDGGYYAEVWTNGMDSSMNCWTVEQSGTSRPTAFPLILFDRTEDEDMFNKHDLNEMLEACLGYRRLVTWFGLKPKEVISKGREYGYYADEIWKHTLIEQEMHYSCPDLIRAYFSHYSQPEVSFWINAELINLNSLPVQIALGTRNDPSSNGFL